MIYGCIKQNPFMKLKLLVIDDEPVNLLLTRKMLAGRNYEIDECEDVNAGLRMLSAKAYDIVLIDINMPEIDGVEGAKLIKKVSDSTKVFALTSDISRHCIDIISQEPFDKYLTKPYTQKAMLELFN